MKRIWEEISNKFNVSWLEVLEFRKNHAGTPEQAIRALNYHYLEKLSNRQLFGSQLQCQQIINQEDTKQLLITEKLQNFSHKKKDNCNNSFMYEHESFTVYDDNHHDLNKYFNKVVDDSYKYETNDLNNFTRIFNESISINEKCLKNTMLKEGQIIDVFNLNRSTKPVKSSQIDCESFRNDINVEHNTNVPNNLLYSESKLRSLKVCDEKKKIDTQISCAQSGDYLYCEEVSERDKIIPSNNVDSKIVKPPIRVENNINLNRKLNNWDCETCTYINMSNVNVCQICGKSRQKGNEDEPLISGGKECPKCTLVNKKDVKVCDACETSLNDSPTYI